MQSLTPHATEGQLTMLQHRVGWYRRLSLGLGVLLVAGLSVAARPGKAVLERLQMRHLDIVDTSGRVVVQLAATQTGGGYLQIIDQEGHIAFSVSAMPGETDVWEQTRQSLAQQQLDLERQSRLIATLRQELRDSQPPSRRARQPEPQRQTIDHLQHEVARQRRALEVIEREVHSLARQLRSLERR